MSLRSFTAAMFTLALAGSAFAQGLPTGWTSKDIGVTGAAGKAATAGSTFVVDGAGLDVWGTADQFQFAYKTLTGDGTIVAQVATLENVASWTKAGVMMRETLTDGSKHAFMLVSPGKGLAFQRRPSTGGVSVHTAGGTGLAPYFLKIERKGSAFTASKSLDGVTWTVVGTQTMNMTATIYVGVAVSSHITGTLATGTFDRVAVTPAAAPAPAPAPAPASTSQLRVLTWNVRHGGTRADGVYDPENTVNWILKMNPDIASLNEFDNATQVSKIVSLLEQKTGLDWDYQYVHGNLVVSKLDVLDKDTCLVNAGDDRLSSFMSVVANGRTISVFSSHLTLDNAERVGEVVALQACASNKVQNRILAGDYNTGVGSAAYNQAVIGYTDAWKVAKALGTAVNYAGNCDGCTRNSRIDYVFTSTGAASLVLKSAQVYDTRNASGVMASDHKPTLVVYDVK
jgi:endonuclease/exonuclease/phosphatase family metal-dependent hydrolase